LFTVNGIAPPPNTAAPVVELGGAELSVLAAAGFATVLCVIIRAVPEAGGVEEPGESLRWEAVDAGVEEVADVEDVNWDVDERLVWVEVRVGRNVDELSALVVAEDLDVDVDVEVLVDLADVLFNAVVVPSSPPPCPTEGTTTGHSARTPLPSKNRPISVVGSASTPLHVAFSAAVMVSSPSAHACEQGASWGLKSARWQPGMGVLYALVQAALKPSICWNWESVMKNARACPRRRRSRRSGERSVAGAAGRRGLMVDRWCGSSGREWFDTLCATTKELSAAMAGKTRSCGRVCGLHCLAWNVKLDVECVDDAVVFRGNTSCADGIVLGGCTNS
jgi:hypothetical protein